MQTNKVSQKSNFICNNYLTKVVYMKFIDQGLLNYYIALFLLQVKSKLCQ